MKSLSLIRVQMISVLIALSGPVAFSQLDLSGEWRFKIDPEGKGLHEKWYKTQLDEKINLPVFQ